MVENTHTSSSEYNFFSSDSSRSSASNKAEEMGVNLNILKFVIKIWKVWFKNSYNTWTKIELLKLLWTTSKIKSLWCYLWHSSINTFSKVFPVYLPVSNLISLQPSWDASDSEFQIEWVRDLRRLDFLWKIGLEDLDPLIASKEK